MSDPTRTTGATLELIPKPWWNIQTSNDRWECKSCYGAGEYGDEDGSDWCSHCGGQGTIPATHCIVPRSFVDAVDAAIDEAEELDYSPPYIRIPLGKWHDVENARDTFREAGE